MSRVEACVLCFLLAMLSPAVTLCTAGNAAPLSTGFSLPIVSNHHETLPAAADLTYIRPKIAPVVFPSFSVVVGVGTGQHRHFYKLALDLIGSLTWMQCKPSNPEVPQQGPIYDSDASRHFRHVLPTDPVCVAPYTHHGHDRCSFGVRFRSATAHGYLGTDEFAFASSTPGGNHVNSVAGLVFGCSHTTHGFVNHLVLAGAMSLNRHPTSFLRQLSERGVANSRFSYCLFRQSHATSGRHGYLRFGVDIPDHSHAQSTALMYSNTNLYYVRIAGISLDGRRITTITPAMFQLDPHSHLGRSIIDVGTSLTRIVREAYDILEAEVAAHLRRHGARVVPVPGHRLCVLATDLREHHLPSVTLHFHEGTELEIKPQLLFMTWPHENRQHLCFGVLPDAERTVIGAGQQVNTRFTFDLEQNKVFFAPEPCHEDTPQLHIDISIISDATTKWNKLNNLVQVVSRSRSHMQNAVSYFYAVASKFAIIQ